MAPMATSEPQVSSPFVIVRPPDQWLAGLLWLLVSVAGGLVGALLAWRIRALVDRGPESIGDLLRYLATIAAAVILSGAQWIFLRRYHLEVYWWVPASVAASLVDALVVIPSVLGFFVTPAATGPVGQNVAIVAGALALAAAGAGSCRRCRRRSAGLGAAHLRWPDRLGLDSGHGRRWCSGGRPDHGNFIPAVWSSGFRHDQRGRRDRRLAGCREPDTGAAPHFALRFLDLRQIAVVTPAL